MTASAPSPTPGLAIRAVSISCRHERRWTLRKVSFDIAPGRLVGLIGDNGAGKSTLLRLLGGRQRPAEGETFIAGLRVQSPLPAELRRRVAYLGHQVFVYPDLTGLENLRFFLGLYRGPGHEGLAPGLLEAVGLEGAASAFARTYSRGMLQRLALGRILAQDADVWLLDEPTTGLDQKGIAVLRRLLTELAARGGSALVATHDRERFEDDFAELLVLDGGRLQRDREGGA
jgi:heme exporter protein A